MKKRELKVFIDFDGTITLKDVGEEVFNRFGESERVKKTIDDLLHDRISSRQCWDELCRCVERIDSNELNSFIDSIETDPTFLPFVRYCSESGIETVVLSDGFDYYIDRIFSKDEELKGLKYYSNRLFLKDGKFYAEYPYFDPGSPVSANCKRNHIINLSSDDDFTIYIGDGNSDKEAAQYCDFIFAKDGLARFCSIERISFYPFNNFDDVKSKLTELRNRKNLRKRHQAQLKRKSAYLTE